MNQVVIEGVIVDEYVVEENNNEAPEVWTENHVHRDLERWRSITQTKPWIHNVHGVYEKPS